MIELEPLARKILESRAVPHLTGAGPESRAAR